TLADARVACPHNGISILGEKYRMGKAFSDFGGERKAVSERFNSCAICNILSSLNSESTRQTPAGFPLNGVSVNESTIKVLILRFPSCSLASTKHQPILQLTRARLISLSPSVPQSLEPH